MKLPRRRGYKFRPYRLPPRHRRDRRYHPIWKPLAILIPIIVGALTLRGCLG